MLSTFFYPMKIISLYLQSFFKNNVKNGVYYRNMSLKYKSKINIKLFVKLTEMYSKNVFFALPGTLLVDSANVLPAP